MVKILGQDGADAEGKGSTGQKQGYKQGPESGSSQPGIQIADEKKRQGFARFNFRMRGTHIQANYRRDQAGKGNQEGGQKNT